MLQIIILIFIVIFFAANMGGSGIAPSFAVTYCSKILKRKTAILLFGLFVVFGAVLLGRPVAKTLASGIIPAGFINFDNPGCLGNNLQGQIANVLAQNEIRRKNRRTKTNASPLSSIFSRIPAKANYKTS